MTKYARPVDHGHTKDGSDVRMIDVIDTDSYNPRPEWGQTDDALLDRLFSPQLVAEWKANGTWFVEVPDGVEPYASHTGGDYGEVANFLNPDGSDGDGALPTPEPVAEPQAGMAEIKNLN